MDRIRNEYIRGTDQAEQFEAWGKNVETPGRKRGSSKRRFMDVMKEQMQRADLKEKMIHCGTV